MDQEVQVDQVDQDQGDLIEEEVILTEVEAVADNLRLLLQIQMPNPNPPNPNPNPPNPNPPNPNPPPNQQVDPDLVAILNRLVNAQEKQANDKNESK